MVLGQFIPGQFIVVSRYYILLKLKQWPRTGCSDEVMNHSGMNSPAVNCSSAENIIQ